MRVCMLAYSFYINDARIQQYAKALVERGDEVDVIGLRRKDYPAHEIVDGVNVYRIQLRKRDEHGPLTYLYRILRFLVHSGVVLARKHLARPYDLIHVHSVPDFLVFAALVPRWAGARVILDIHDILPELYASKFNVNQRSMLGPFLELVEKCSIAFAHHVIIANHLWWERLISRSVHREKCTPIGNYPEPRFFHPRPPRLADGKFLLMYPGSLNWYQGLDVAIRAVAKVVDQIPELEFHIYGEGPEESNLIRLAKELGLDSKVVFKDFVPVAQIAPVMAGADLAIEPKRATCAFSNEAVSTKILEWMAVGVPVIASKTRVVSYYHNATRLLSYESDSVDALAEKILQARRDEGLRRRLAENGKKYVDTHNWDVKKYQYLELVDSLVPHPEKKESVKTEPPLQPSRPGKVWIDLDNSPHVPFFAPIIQELRRRGCAVVLTARDAFQVYELTDLFKLECKRIGRHYGKNKIRKLVGVCFRALQLLPTVLEERPDLSLAHGSRSQVLLSKILRIPSISIFDYEFGKSFMGIRASWGIMPEVIPDDAIRADKRHILRYPGIKEDVYLPQLKPDPSLRARLGISEEDIMVVLRPPASEAHYHNPQSDELFNAALDFLAQQPKVRVVLLPRTEGQAVHARSVWPSLFDSHRFIVPDHVLDGLNLIWNSDLVVSGGGTMNREAAAVGVPVYSIFRGKIGAVDRYLANQGRLVLLESVDDVRSKIKLVRRPRPATFEPSERGALHTIVDHILAIMDLERRRHMATGHSRTAEPVNSKVHLN